MRLALAIIAILAGALPGSAAIGTIDAAGDLNGTPSVQKGATLYVRGWAADVATGAPVQAVTIFIDGNTLLGLAALGGVRNDVAQAYGRIDFTASGWNFQGSTSALTVGTHSITAVAHSSQDTTLATVNVQITAPPAGAQVRGNIDSAVDYGTGVSPIVQGRFMLVRGWAADSQAGAPVQTVTLSVDGHVMGQQFQSGIDRPDVAQAFQRADFEFSGWSLLVDTTSLAPGSHSVTATATGVSGTSALPGITISIAATVNRVLGFLDSAVDANGATTVVKGTPVIVKGWAADEATGAPVDAVFVYVDGSNMGLARGGLARADVATALGRADFTNSGWTFQLATSGLAVGNHTVTALAYGPSGSAQLMGTKTLIVAAAGGGGQLIGYVDSAGDSNGVASVARGSSLFVKGWAADTVLGAPVQSVMVVVDGQDAGTATLGLPRADVANAFNRSDFTNSGWSFQMSTTALTVGAHTVTARAIGPSGTSPLTGSKQVNITGPGPSGQVVGFLDSAVLQGNVLTVQGWAADINTGAPVQVVTVTVNGNLFQATLGRPRPDVALALNRPDFANSGWILQGNIPLQSGPNTITATGYGVSGQAPLVGTKIVTAP